MNGLDSRVGRHTATHIHPDVTSPDDKAVAAEHQRFALGHAGAPNNADEGQFWPLGHRTSVRKTKELRREQILEAALAEFAELGLNGASVEDIARRVGISQPYVFRLFSTKKNLFKAVVARCFRETVEGFQRAAAGKSGREALDEIGRMYEDQLSKHPERLRLQMQAFAACSDPEIRDVVREGVGDLVACVDRAGGITDEESARFFGSAMLMNLLAALRLVQGVEPWAGQLVTARGSQLPRL